MVLLSESADAGGCDLCVSVHAAGGGFKLLAPPGRRALTCCRALIFDLCCTSTGVAGEQQSAPRPVDRPRRWHGAGRRPVRRRGARGVRRGGEKRTCSSCCGTTHLPCSSLWTLINQCSAPCWYQSVCEYKEQSLTPRRRFLQCPGVSGVLGSICASKVGSWLDSCAFTAPAGWPGDPSVGQETRATQGSLEKPKCQMA